MCVECGVAPAKLKQPIVNGAGGLRQGRQCLSGAVPATATGLAALSAGRSALPSHVFAAALF